MNLGRASLVELEARVVQQSSEFVAAIDSELALLRRQRDELNERIKTLARKRLMYIGRSEEPGAGVVGSDIPSKPVAVRQVLQEVAPQSLRLREIHEELVRRGWSANSKRDRHALEVAVRALEERDVLSRPSRGYYRIRVEPDSALDVAA